MAKEKGFASFTPDQAKAEIKESKKKPQNGINLNKKQQDKNAANHKI